MSSESEHIASGYHVWEVPDKPASIQISLDVIDRLQQDVVRGFGAVPRRGAEVGGILLGSASAGPVARVEAYELIPIEYKRGPSYLLSEEDRQAFQAAFDRLRDEATPALHPIGYFRSHTRDGDGLDGEDRDLLAQYFPEPEAIVLWIRPFATKPCEAGFYFREDGEFPAGPPLAEFPFRRKELDPDDTAPPPRPPERPVRRMEPSGRHDPPPRHAAERRPRLPIDRPPIPPERPQAPAERLNVRTGEPPSIALPADLFRLDDQQPKRRRSFIWLPLSLIFLLLGVLLGFQVALTWRPHGSDSSDPYHVALSVTKSGSDLQVQWDRQASAIKAAKKGRLTIEDGTFTKPIDLDAGQLRNGGVVVYRHFSGQVRFRLDLTMSDQNVLTETVDWKQPAQVSPENAAPEPTSPAKR